MLHLNAVVLLLLLFFIPPVSLSLANEPSLPRFAEAPHYRNGENCPAPTNNASLLHIAMTLDAAYLRGTIAAVHSVLRHATCPQNLFFHFIAGDADSLPDSPLRRLLQSTFPSLRRQSRVHLFREGAVSGLISASVRPALERPLNYARNYLGDILVDVERVIYLDSDLVVVDDIGKLWRVTLPPWRVIAAPEYCHANLSKYFTGRFWGSPVLSRALASKRACYFNTGVMVMNLATWRKGRYTLRLERWMRVQKSSRIYELGSLPPFLLVFGGEVEPLPHRWNHHGLGGDNVEGLCRELHEHEGPVSLLHWSGKGKPWLRLDSHRPCPLDRLWHPYDLFLPSSFFLR
uniref:Hexosyltransferase n=2 Tax=Cajanus cajan TaxID=3821 RepID=A0A151R1M0_CAJCA|nr:Glycosyltransferase 8 domain-containing protein 2 [Cajanus cajan]